jgi:hypothetical protein
MDKLFEWHKGFTNRWKDRLGLSDYGMLWVAFSEGVAMGFLLCWLLL